MKTATSNRNTTLLTLCLAGLTIFGHYVLADCNCKIARDTAACVACVENCCTMKLRQDATPCQAFSSDYVVGCECGMLNGAASDCVVKLDANGQMVVVNNVVVRIFPGQCSTGCCDFDVVNAYDYPGNWVITTTKACYGYA